MDGGELLVAVEGRQEEAGRGRAGSGSQVWDGGSVQQAATGGKVVLGTREGLVIRAFAHDEDVLLGTIV